MIRFSVIVPIYNVTGFIKSGLRQLEMQSYGGDWEILLVDDGSTDNSGDLIEAASKDNPRIRVFQQANAGAGAARNLGIDNARGEYVWFYDIDDEIDSDLLYRLDIALQDAHNPQMAVFGFSESDVKTGNMTIRSFRPLTLNSNNDVRDAWPEHLSGARGGNNGFVWNKAYRLDFLNNKRLRFGDERIQQDEVFNLKVYAEVSTMVVLSDCWYRYKVYDKGNTRSRYIPERLNIYRSVMNSFRDLMVTWNIDSPMVETWLAKRFLGNVIQTMTFNCYHPKSGLSNSERDKCLENIMTDADVRLLLEKLSMYDIKISSFITQCYIRAIRRKSLMQFKLARIFDIAGNNCRKNIRKLINR